jgi:arylsulfatase A-like enzyme
MPPRIGRSLAPAIALALSLPLASRPAAGQAAPAAAPAPTLVVFITVDQLRNDYLERFGSQFTGGLARLTQRGAWFTNGSHDHANTETAPGHASTMSGRFPRSTGIVRNSLGVQDPAHPLIDGEGDPASPERFRGTVLIDWLRARDPRSRALSVSRKDRGAILPIGRAKQDVYWYAPLAGRFTTSTYYRDTLPTWVRRFNDRCLPQATAGRVWEPLLGPEAYPEPDTVWAEGDGWPIAFPHQMPNDTAVAKAFLPEFPWMDEITLQFALAGLRELRLGAGPQTDVLAISLSATDAVGHRYGPDSKEVHDQILHVDRYLGQFFDSLFAIRDSTRIVVALTADHGVAPLLGAKQGDTDAGKRLVRIGSIYARTRAGLERAGVPRSAFRFEDWVLYVDREAFRHAGVNADSTVRVFATQLRSLPGVLRVDRFRDLARADTVKDAIARRWLHAFPPDFPVELAVTLKPYYVVSETQAEHGSPHDYDAHVPVVLYGPPFAPGRYAPFVRVVDMAPTLAHVVGVHPLERLDGRVLTEALRTR